MTATTERDQATHIELRRYDSVVEMLPDVNNPTPMVRLNRVMTTPETYLKLEWLGPFGSVKDRTAHYLYKGLAERGELAQREIIEASSGNTAIALAALAGLDGIATTVTVPDGIPEENKTILRMLGAEVWETPDDVCPVDHPRDGAIALARAFAASSSRYVMANQYENVDNIKAHFETTGPEIWRQTEGRVRWFVAGLGTTGTVIGTSRYLKEQDPDVRVIGVEPQIGHRIPGMKNFSEASQPSIADWSVVDEIVRVDDAPSYEHTKRLWREEGLMVGPSTGAVIAAIASLDIPPDDLVVGISADSGFKYGSYFDEILGSEGRPSV